MSRNVQARQESREVFHATDEKIAVDRNFVDILKASSEHSDRHRSRLCAHTTPNDRLHEMLIVHERGAYVRPHRHREKSESMHVIEGEADLVWFDEQGRISDLVPLGDYRSGKSFFYRASVSDFHTLLIRSPIFIFHEVTNGPFRREDTIFPSWAPEEEDKSGQIHFMEKLGSEIETFVRHS